MKTVALGIASYVALSGLPTLAQDPPKGEVAKYTFADSKIFPGTTRDYWVYVPKQYDPAKPACLYVNQDGVQYKAPQVFDELIAKGEMPVTIGVFVMHGRVKAPNDRALDRFNRSYEYDGLGPNYARFLIEELLPDVETRTASDGRPIKLSKDPNDCAIGGGSSGAIAAFTAAWERPDRFRRVFSSIGTYVGLRGGNEYPTLIRKTEPKPIRIFLEDGENDLNIYGGDWWMANQEMERAFKFAGYEVEHAWGKGGHNGQHATEVFPDAMRWLWKGYPEPIKAGAGSPQLQEIVRPGEDWEVVSSGNQYVTAMAAGPSGEVVYQDFDGRETFRVGADGKAVSMAKDAPAIKAYGPDGKGFAIESDRIAAVDAEGRVATVAEGVEGNDLVVAHGGGIFVSDPGGTRRVNQVWHVAPGERPRVVASDLAFPQGITLSPDQTLLYVAERDSHWVKSFQVRPDGSLEFGQRYYRLHVPDTADSSGASDLAVDRDGRLYVATTMGVQVCDQAGRVNVILPTPNVGAGRLCFGGKDFDELYVSSGDRVFRRKLKVRGANAFEPPTKPAAPRL